MKKSLLILLALILLLSSCNRVVAEEVALEEQMRHICNALGGEEHFMAADADFCSTNLGASDYLAEARVSFGNGGKTREIGLFRLNDRRHAKELMQSLRGYLDGEWEALTSLSALYPAKELEERLSLYKNATVGSEGMLVYYFVLDDADTQKALMALTGRE